MRSMTVSLSPRQAELIDEAVSAGTYTSDADAVRDALTLWEERQSIRQAEIARLKQAYDEGLASGPGRDVDVAELLAGFRQRSGHG